MYLKKKKKLRSIHLS